VGQLFTVSSDRKFGTTKLQITSVVTRMVATFPRVKHDMATFRRKIETLQRCK
jgi:hypothetical protein